MTDDRATTALFTQALDVINAAIAENRDSALFEPLLSACEKVLGDSEIGVAVHASDSSSPFDHFTIRYREGGFEFVSRGGRHPDVTWKVSRDYLQKVADNPRDYIENPLALDWDWLKDRLRLD